MAARKWTTKSNSSDTRCTVHSSDLRKSYACPDKRLCKGVGNIVCLLKGALTILVGENPMFAQRSILNREPETERGC
eukprot:10626778-Heterocapsa_arctica.AAC.1